MTPPTLIGDKQVFAAEVGAVADFHNQLRRVDFWAAGHWLTCDDNLAYVPSFRHSIQRDLADLRSHKSWALPYPGLSAVETHRRFLVPGTDGLCEELREDHRFFYHGETTDNLICSLFRVGSLLQFTFEFWREHHHIPEDLGKVFVAEVPDAEMLRVLEGVVKALQPEDPDKASMNSPL